MGSPARMIKEDSGAGGRKVCARVNDADSSDKRGDMVGVSHPDQGGVTVVRWAGAAS